MAFSLDDSFNDFLKNAPHSAVTGRVPGRLPKQVMNDLLDEILDKDGDNNPIAPDTHGADCFFVRSFVNDEMSYDFDLIVYDFMERCRNRIPEFNDIDWYGDGLYEYASQESIFQEKMLGYILNGFKAGDEYCRELLKKLYKIFYKKEYQQLKRFSHISEDEIRGLAYDEYSASKVDIPAVARILVMCSVFGIETEPDVCLLYEVLNRKNKRREKDSEIFCDNDFTTEIFDECLKQVDEWEAGDRKKNGSDIYKTMLQDDQFVNACLRRQGYPGDYAFTGIEHYDSFRMMMARTYALLKSVYPKKEFTYEEVQHYVGLYTSTTALAHISDRFMDEMETVLGLADIDDAVDDAMFIPGCVPVQGAAVNSKSDGGKNDTRKNAQNASVRSGMQGNAKADPTGTVKPAGDGIGSLTAETHTKEEYVAEIQELRRRLRLADEKNSKMYDELKVAQKSRAEAETERNRYAEEHDELVTLREFVASLAEQQETSAEIPYEEMCKTIASRKIAIVGGHINWVNKLKAIFPDWYYIISDNFKNYDGSMLDDMDCVYFFTAHISHSNYGKFVNITRERKIPIGYISGVNVENVVRQIYAGLDKPRN